MSPKLFVTVFDTNAQPVRLNLQHVTSFKVTASGTTVTMVDGQQICLSVEELDKIAPYLDAMTHKREPLITK